MGNGNTNATPTRTPGQPIVEHASGSNGSSELRIDPSETEPQENRPRDRGKNPYPTPSRLCGAMSQQGGEFLGNVSAPQKFVHLVGCRDRGAAPAEARQYSHPVKR